MNYTTKSTTGSCPKAGIKIHETKPSSNSHSYANTNANKNIFNTTRSTNQTNYNNPVNYYNTSMNQLDLDLENYSLRDLYNLFNINDELDEESLKTAKKIVLKMHPDKSRLDQKYFLFFSKAYKRLFSVYEFQNKSKYGNNNNNNNTKTYNNTYSNEDYYDDSNKTVLNQMFESNKSLKEGGNFNKWFNQQFEKHRIEDETQNAGYGDWLKSEDTPFNVDENVTKANMNEYFEKQKKKAQSLTVYNGITDPFASTLGGTLLNSDTSNFTNVDAHGGLTYTDLKQAYMESVIPVTQDDFDRIPKYNSVNEYKTQRDRVDITPISKEEGERLLTRNQNKMDQESAALAYKYARETEIAKEKNKSFWGDIKRITGL